MDQLIDDSPTSFGASPKPFVPASFDVPDRLESEEFGFRLEPLGPEHNERDYAAWNSSIDHIRATPGWHDYPWPTPMSLDDNRRDLVEHAEDFRDRRGFTYSVLIGDDVIGCVYIYPDSVSGQPKVKSWVRASHAHLDKPLHDVVEAWLRAEWPFSDFVYASR
jgi:RimJ/RimL family protein N-acetyltransferase